MEIRIKELDREHGVVALVLSGDIDSTTATQFKSLLQSQFDQERFRLLLDFGNVQYINSAGMGVVAGAIKTAAENGGAVRFLHVDGALAELFHIVRFDKLVPYFDDEPSALASLA